MPGGGAYRSIGGATIPTDAWRRPVVLLLALACVAVLGGLAGGMLALAIGDGDGDPGPATPVVAGSPTAAPTPAAGGAIERLQAAIDRVMPAVVSIVADFPPRPVEGGQIIRQNIGSGVVISRDGLVMTNYHVIDGASSLTVVFSTGERRDATLVDDDSPFLDLAVLRTAPEGLRAATLGDSETLRPGDLVAAIAGGLVTFENQVKVGVVSATGVPFPRPGLIQEDMIQTDAAVNHGDSGGALINDAGEVVGLVTTVVRETPDGRTVQGVALAHSINSLRPVLDAIASLGENPRRRYGFERLNRHHAPVTPELVAEFGLPVSDGAVIVEVEPGSPAERAGLRPGDIVVRVNGVAVDGDRPLVNLLTRLPGDGTAELLVVRGGAEVVVTVTPTSGREED